MEKTTKSQIIHNEDCDKLHFKFKLNFRNLSICYLGCKKESLQESEMISERKLQLLYVLIAIAISPLDSMLTTSLQLRNRLEPSPGLDEDKDR